MPFLSDPVMRGEPTSCVSNTAVFPSRSITPSTFTRIPSVPAYRRWRRLIGLQRSERRALVTITQAILAYRAIRAVPPSTQQFLDTLITDVGSRALTDVDYTWAEAWIRAMKLEKRLAPGSIRKRKGGLSNVFDWIVRAHPTCLGSNPLDQLPHGYSGYDEYTRQALAEQGVDIPGDVERNRRVDPAEERRRSAVR
jgi:hypothetical protein